MQKREVDVAILGAGTSGLVARRTAEAEGADAVLIDPGPFGTTCARVGCMPSKLLISAAEAAHHARHADVFGVHAEVSVDGKKVMERVRKERDFFVGFVLDSIENIKSNDALIQGRGKLIDAHTIQVEDIAQVKAKTIIIGTGSTHFVPPPFRGLSSDVMIYNDDVFYWDDLPESVLVVGTGVVGMEIGQSLHRLGVRTTLVGIGGLIGPLSDPKMLSEAHRIFGAELDIHPDYTLETIEEVDGGAFVSFTDPDGSKHEGTYQYVLMAAGRKPNTEGLGLEHAGIDIAKNGMEPWDRYTTQYGDTHVFFAGDVSGHRPLLHEAADEGRIAGRNAAHFPNSLVMPRTTGLGVVFSDPQIAVVGKSWKTMNCDRNRVGEVDYRRQGRARVMNQNEGLVRIYGELHTGLLTGAEMLGPRVEHTSHLLAWAIEQRMTASELLKMPFYHPVIEEGIRTALRELESQLQLARKPGAACEEFGPGD